MVTNDCTGSSPFWLPIRSKPFLVISFSSWYVVIVYPVESTYKGMQAAAEKCHGPKQEFSDRSKFRILHVNSCHANNHVSTKENRVQNPKQKSWPKRQPKWSKRDNIPILDIRSGVSFILLQLWIVPVLNMIFWQHFNKENVCQKMNKYVNCDIFLVWGNEIHF